jgi:hypothetical protein
VATCDRRATNSGMPKHPLPSNLLDDNAIPSPADIAVALRACPELLEHPALEMMMADADAAGITDAELQAMHQAAVDSEGLSYWSWPAPSRAKPLGDAATQALAVLYPDGIPSRPVLPDKALVQEVCEYMIHVMGIADIVLRDDGSYSAARTVLRAAGRRK